MTTIKKINKSNLKLAVKFLNEGNLVSFPTETVYGLGGDATNSLSIAKIYETKNRPIFNPLIIHFSSFDQIILYQVLLFPSLLNNRKELLV